MFIYDSYNEGQTVLLNREKGTETLFQNFISPSYGFHLRPVEASTVRRWEPQTHLATQKFIILIFQIRGVMITPLENIRPGMELKKS